MNAIRQIETDDEIKIFSDPYRMKIINAYIKARKPLTVKGVADIMGEVPAKVHYHVKKLLSIDILVLDHTEVINGITAKYYKLTTEQFKVSYQNVNNHEALFDSTTNMILSVVDEFKEDIMKGAKYLKQVHERKDESRNGYIDKEEIYLNEKEYFAFAEEMRALIERYQIEGDQKAVYNIFTGWFKKYW
ncbi:ArsR family transcriptional regulator [Petrocella atlantisensis]|uniref:ArsR family transcriptional regulator n=1 Tax=Petrocella atlantisensis TaxID=2173034 RepID=A0A3P7SAR1_9FIRM|nr:helix-turn-helix transcriptional regulator [Petrocella atlantisensis]MCF8018678.1 helix-turn-helix transcriptional regulator [Vallitaleaceae bacterium]VDN48939.1 ArsR family transcriptional regulator [Petrocella atlantisensis]